MTSVSVVDGGAFRPKTSDRISSVTNTRGAHHNETQVATPWRFSSFPGIRWPSTSTSCALLLVVASDVFASNADMDDESPGV